MFGDKLSYVVYRTHHTSGKEQYRVLHHAVRFCKDASPHYFLLLQLLHVLGCITNLHNTFTVAKYCFFYRCPASVLLLKFIKPAQAILLEHVQYVWHGGCFRNFSRATFYWLSGELLNWFGQLIWISYKEEQKELSFRSSMDPRISRVGESCKGNVNLAKHYHP